MINIIIFLIMISNTFFLYLLIKNILYGQFIAKRLKKGEKTIKIDKNIEAKMLLRKRNIMKKDVFTKLGGFLSGASVHMDEKKFLKLTIIGCFFVFISTWIIKKSILFSFIAALMVIGMIYILLKHRNKKRIEKFSSQLPEITEFLSSSLKSGYSLMQALNMIVEEIAPPASVEFKRVLQDIRVGKTYEEAFDFLVEKNPIEDVEIVATAILINKEAGGNLSHILDTVSSTMRERETLQKEIKSLTAQGRLSGIVLVMLPIAIFAFLYMVNTDYINLLLTHPVGRMMLVGGISSQIIGGFMIKLIIKIDG